MISDEDLVSFCQKALRIPSMSGHEDAIARMLQAKMLEFELAASLRDQIIELRGK